jgi:hypothetical protein
MLIPRTGLRWLCFWNEYYLRYDQVSDGWSTIGVHLLLLTVSTPTSSACNEDLWSHFSRDVVFQGSGDWLALGRLESVVAMSLDLQESSQRGPQESFKSDHNVVVWIHDKDSQDCTACKKPFGFFRRRHHCRACGKVVASVIALSFALA